MIQTGKITALYARFSHDEGNSGHDSNSIANQKELLAEYANTHGFINHQFYTDDGYSGTNFERPAFQKMMTDVENGLIGTIIVKDMSRLGRNYLMVGQYTEIIFPEYNVRFVAISDNVDSAEGVNRKINAIRTAIAQCIRINAIGWFCISCKYNICIALTINTHTDGFTNIHILQCF